MLGCGGDSTAGWTWESGIDVVRMARVALKVKTAGFGAVEC